MNASNAHTAYHTDFQSAALKCWDTIDLKKNPTYVILDIGCTRSMGSRHAVEKFAALAEKKGLQLEFLPSSACFSFANSQSTRVTEKMRVWFNTSPPCSTDIDIVEEGTVPILMSLPQMKNLGMSLEMTPDTVYMTCPAFGSYKQPLMMSVSNHLCLDLADVKSSPKTH